MVQVESRTSRELGNDGGRGRTRRQVARAKQLVEQVRDKADIVVRDRPYLVPIAAGAVGLGLGVILSSRIMRFVIFTAVGTMITERFGDDIRRISRDLVDDLGRRLGEGEEEPEAG